MRRVATVLMVLACTLAGVSAWGAVAPDSGDVARGAVTPAQQATAPSGGRAREAGAQAQGAAARGRTAAAGAGTKKVAFAGYTIDIPASWPVYRLARDPYRCVRYDQNALYLGQPGANQQCPAHLAGRVATLSLAKAHLTASERRELPARGVVAWDSPDHEMGALLPRHALSITATYGAAAGQIKDILATLRWAATGQPVATVLVRGSDPPRTPRWPTAQLLRHRAGGGVRVGQPVGRMDPGQRADGLGDDAGVRRPAGAVHQLPRADPARPGGVAGPCLRPQRDPPGPAPRYAPRGRALRRHGGLPPAPRPVQPSGGGLPRRLDQGTARARVPRRGVLKRRGGHPGPGPLPARLRPPGRPAQLAVVRPLGRAANLRGTPYARNNWWHAHRIKQYRGARHRRIGGIRLSFDSDLVDGAVYR